MASTRTIKVTGVSDELLNLLDDRIRSQHASGRAEYIRELIRRDVLSARNRRGAMPEKPFGEMIAPFHAESRLRDDSENEFEVLLEEGRSDVEEPKNVAETDGENIAAIVLLQEWIEEDQSMTIEEREEAEREWVELEAHLEANPVSMRVPRSDE